MATTLTVNTTSRSPGIDLSSATAADATGNNWATNGTEVLYVQNPTGGSITITEVFGTGGTIDGQTAAGKQIVVTAGQRILLGPYPTQWYADASGKMNVTYSAGGLNVLVFQLASS